LHHYAAEGMEMGDFEEAIDDIDNLIREYEEFDKE
jgi:hypothetical protein